VSTPPLLELRDVHAAYGNIEVLHGLDLCVAAGEIVAVLGPNGAGKTTTLGVATGAIRPTAGDLLLAGREVTGCSAGDLARVGVCTVPEGRGVFPNLTVRENLLMATYMGSSLHDIEERTYARFPRLQDRRSQMAGTLSGGEQQMLALARALAIEPMVLLLDELSMGLAPLVVRELYERVATIAAEGVGVIVVEQFAHTVLQVATSAVVIAGGRVRFSGPAGALDDDTLAAAYLGHVQAQTAGVTS
jgi:branched-chain amino acid transport system ATP-binding protein